MAIRSPVVIVVDDGDMWTPDPAAIITRIDPVAIIIQLFRAPDVRVVVTITLLVAQTRRQVTLAVVHPRVPAIEGGRSR
jgi:hypothetical protein